MDTSNVQQHTLGVAAVNDAPALTLGPGPSGYTEGDGPAAIDPALSITDVDSSTLVSATVRIASGYQIGVDILAATAVGALSVSWDSSTGTLTISGSGTLAEYQSVLRSVTFTNNSDDPSTATRTIEYIVSDGVDTSNVQQHTLGVSAVDDPPPADPPDSPPPDEPPPEDPPPDDPADPPVEEPPVEEPPVDDPPPADPPPDDPADPPVEEPPVEEPPVEEPLVEEPPVDNPPPADPPVEEPPVEEPPVEEPPVEEPPVEEPPVDDPPPADPPPDDPADPPVEEPPGEVSAGVPSSGSGDESGGGTDPGSSPVNGGPGGSSDGGQSGGSSASSTPPPPPPPPLAPPSPPPPATGPQANPSSSEGIVGAPSTPDAPAAPTDPASPDAHEPASESSENASTPRATDGPDASPGSAGAGDTSTAGGNTAAGQGPAPATSVIVVGDAHARSAEWTYWLPGDLLSDLGQTLAGALTGSHSKVVILGVSGVVVGAVYILSGVLGTIGFRAGRSAVRDLHSFDLALLLQSGETHGGKRRRLQPWPFQADTGSFCV